jgi:hypothetical protein
MSASSRPTADKQRSPETHNILNAHRKALQTRKSGGEEENGLFRHKNYPAKLAFFCLAGNAFFGGIS